MTGIADINKHGGSGQASREADRDAAGGIAGGAVRVGALTAVSRVSGLARDIVLGGLFGASGGMDAFFVAFRIPNLFRRVAAEGAASIAFVPVFSGIIGRQGRLEGNRAIAAVGGAALLGLLLLTLTGVFFADEVVSVFAPGFSADEGQFELAVMLTRALFPYLLLVGMAAWAMGALHSYRRFTAPATGPVLLNISIIVAAVALAGKLVPAVMALVVGVLVGGVFQFAVQIKSLLKEGINPVPSWRPRHPAVRQVGVLLGPAVFGAAVYQINVLVSTILASVLQEGSVSWLWYADRIFEFPLGIIAVAIGTAALPRLSEQAAAGDTRGMAASLAWSLQMAWSLCIPAALAIWLLAPEIVSALFERGQFSAADTAATALALRASSLGLLGVASVRVLVNVFYAMKKPSLPVMAAVVALVANVVFDVAFMGPAVRPVDWWGGQALAGAVEFMGVADFDHAGLALGAALASMCNAAVLFFFVARQFPDFGRRIINRELMVQLVATAVMGAVLFVAKPLVAQLPGGALAALPLLVGAGGACYVVVSFLLGSEITRSMIDRARSGPRQS